ncbi:universal stress protein [Thermodesulfobacteriota bacterium]
MNPEEKKVLLAVDGSRQSLNTVDYASRLLPSDRTEVVLFNVLSRVPEFFDDLGKLPKHGRTIEKGWETAISDSINQFMSDAARIFMGRGFPQEALTIKVESKKEGVARDIISESYRGYDVVLMGRNGFNMQQEPILGSIAGKLIEKISHESLCVVGANPETQSILLALDASERSMLAVEFVGEMLSGSDVQLTLFHAIRGPSTFQQRFRKIFNLTFEDEWIETGLYEMKPLLREYKNRLVRAGFDPRCITTKINTKVSNRSVAIVEEAVKGGYGTIVVGRRGLSAVEAFFMGRVGRKVLQLAKEQAVWVVSK